MLSFVLALVGALHPQARHVGDVGVVSRAIAQVVSEEEPLPSTTRERTAAILVVMAWHESRFSMGVVGDNGRAFCALQVHGAPSLAKSPVACIRTAMRHMRASMRSCPDAPLAAYAGGCKSPPARAISAARLREAEIVEAVALAAARP